MRRRGKRGEEPILKWRLTGEIGVGKNEGRITSLASRSTAPVIQDIHPLGKFPGESPQGPERDVHVDVGKRGRLCSSEGLTQEMETSVVEAQWS